MPVLAFCVLLLARPVAAQEGHTTPPELVELSISPSTVDTSADAAQITVEARITDQGSGATYSSISFHSPSRQHVGASLSDYERISGTTADGIYRTVVAASPPARWESTAATTAPSRMRVGLPSS